MVGRVPEPVDRSCADAALDVVISSLIAHKDPDGALVDLLDGYRPQWRGVLFTLPFSLSCHFRPTNSPLSGATLDANNIPRGEVDTPIAAFEHAPLLIHLRLFAPRILSSLGSSE